MTTVEALRTCLYENGIEMLLDYPKLRGKLWDLAPAELLLRDRFRAIYDSGAVEHIRFNKALNIFQYVRAMRE